MYCKACYQAKNKNMKTNTGKAIYCTYVALFEKLRI